MAHLTNASMCTSMYFLASRSGLFPTNSLSYKVFDLIEQYSNQRPSLVFCATRNGAKNLALQVLKEATRSETQKSIFLHDSKQIE